jgi:hypothetical protein
MVTAFLYKTACSIMPQLRHQCCNIKVCLQEPELLWLKCSLCCSVQLQGGFFACFLQASALTRMVTNHIKEAESVLELADVVDEWGSSFDYIHTAAAFTRAGNVSQRQPAAAQQALLNKLVVIWDSQLPDALPRELSNVLWACGKLRYTSPQLWSSTLAAFRQRLHDGQQPVQGQNIAIVLHGAANAALANKGEVPGISKRQLEAIVSDLGASMRVLVTNPVLQGVTLHNISNTLWGCAKLRINPGDAALNSLLQAMARPAMLEAADSQHLSNTLRAVSELQQRRLWQLQVHQRVWQRVLGEQ